MKTILALLLLASNASAETLMWDPPTQREDGSPLQPGDLKEYRLYDKRIYQKAIPAPTTSTTIYISPGSHAWEVTAVDQNKLQSGYSNSVVWMPTPVPTLQWPPSEPGTLRLAK